MFESNVGKDPGYLVVPMLWATSQAVLGALEQPIFILLCVGVPNRGFDDSYLVRGKDTLAKGVFAVALFECTSSLNRHTDNKAEGIRTKDWSVFLRFSPNALFVIA